MRELMWRMDYSDEGFDEEVVEADHPGSWQKWKEKILSQWNKVELTSNIFKQPLRLLFEQKYLVK